MYSVRFGDFTIEGVADWRMVSGYRVSRYHFPRRPGSISPRVPAKDAKVVRLQCELWKDSEAQIKSYFQALGTKLDEGRNRLFLRDDNFYLNATAGASGLEQAFTSERVPVNAVPYTIEFEVDDPHWYSPDAFSQVENVGAVNVATFAITYNGGARTPPVIKVTRTDPANDQANVIVTQTTTGFFLRWNGTLPDENSIIFDCVNRRVVALGGNGLTAFDGNIRLELEPGLNNFRYEGPGNVAIDVAWQERWGQL